MKIKAFSLLACVFCILISLPSWADIREGGRAYKEGDYLRAFHIWDPLAQQGNVNALFNVAQLYRKGLGVSKNMIRAEEYYLKAAQGGHVLSARNLGVLYSRSDFPNYHLEEAVRWYAKAAIDGDAVSQFRLGSIFYKGKIVQKNRVKAYSWFYLAQEQGHKKANLIMKQLASQLNVNEIHEAEEYVYLIKQQKRERHRYDFDLYEQKLEARNNNTQAANTDGVGAVRHDNSKAKLGKKGYFAQLTSFEASGSAQNEWENIKSLDEEFFNKVEDFAAIYKVQIGNKTYNRLQVGPFVSLSKGKEFCLRVQSYGHDCFLWERGY